MFNVSLFRYFFIKPFSGQLSNLKMKKKGKFLAFRFKYIWCNQSLKKIVFKYFFQKLTSLCVV